MSENNTKNDQNYRLKIRLLSGMEFEAQGDKTFIESQKKEFLQLLSGSKKEVKNLKDIASKEGELAENIQNTLTKNIISQLAKETSGMLKNLKNKPHITEETTTENSNGFGYNLDEKDIVGIWNKLADTKNGHAILYQKPKIAQNSALLILGASKYLLNKKELSALMLSKCIKKSGHITSRLDRVLNDFIDDNTIVSRGTKRNRRYSLSQKGLAKALVLAENFIKEKNI